MNTKHTGRHIAPPCEELGIGAIVHAMTLPAIVAAFRRSAPPAMASREAQADLVEIFKAQRRMELKRNGTLLNTYRVALGFAPKRHKEREGDGRTPEGRYAIDARNPRSAFHLSLRVSYPDDKDKAHAAELGVPPGGDIYIHGQPNGWRKLLVRHPAKDWTTGCIAVTDREMREVWSLVPTGVTVVIHP
jgi:murein L,D-transpeptidase YafK